ncbi:glycosyltransferase [Methylobacterium sp. J-030]|uniref:glycosyltransferase n=1 Tax=Methylobacterium sp. J-030 TaxID=2836627 RepID=UPI001FB8F18B|nr:glycosyltransferase [Methylobacterium sp. J-030]MCJ2070603.1 glycosyltransferase [Methylobacterium sp. J-030]
MRIVYVSSVPVFPTNGGNRAVIFAQIEYFRNLGHEVYFILLTSRQIGSFDEDAHREFFGPNFIPLKRSRAGETLYLFQRWIKIIFRKIKNLSGQQTHLFDSADEIYYSPFDKMLKAIFRRIKPDVCWVPYVFFSRVFLTCGPQTLKVLDTHDSFSHQLAPEKESAGLKRADIVIAIQDLEAAYFKSLLGPEAGRVRTLCLMRERSVAVEQRRSAGATFFGSSFTANIASVQYLIEKVLPEVVRIVPGFKIFVAGSLCRDIPHQKSVVKLGLVKNVEDAYTDAPVLANAITAGTGLKIKLIEALSLGVPAVSTRLGVRGLPDQLLQGVIVVDDDDPIGFARALLTLHQNTEARLALGRSARRAAQQWVASQKAELEAILALTKRDEADRHSI